MAGVPFTLEYYHEVEDQTPYQTDQATGTEALGSNINYYYNINLESGLTPEYHLLSDDFTSTDTWNDVYSDIGQWTGDDVVPLYDLVPTPTPVIPSYEHKVKNIYLGDPRWEPGENTIAYYEFDNNLNDSSGNGRNLIIDSGSVTYGSVNGGGKYAYFNNQTWTKTRNYYPLDYYGNYTVSMWVNLRTIYNSGTHVILDIWESSSKDFVRIHNSLYVSYGTPGTTISVNNQTWYNIIYTRDGSTGKVYKNGTFVGGGTAIDLNGNNKTVRFRINQAGDTGSSSYANDVFLSKIIRESKTRTEQEITDYYDKTKSDYGIS